MTLLAFVVSLVLIVVTGAALVGVALWLAARCTASGGLPAGKAGTPQLQRRKGVGEVC